MEHLENAQIFIPTGLPDLEVALDLREIPFPPGPGGDGCCEQSPMTQCFLCTSSVKRRIDGNKIHLTILI